MNKNVKFSKSNLRTCVIVLGMHRSGTSALTGVINKLGCKLPESLMSSSDSNAKGFFESTAIRDFNDEILASGGSSWDDFTAFSPDWLDSPQSTEFVMRSGELLQQEFGDSHLFALKDPRICRLFPFWKLALAEFRCNIAPILIVRNPLEVSLSLKVKRGFSEPLSQMIWLRHVLDAEKHTRGMIRYHTSYDQLMDNWEILATDARAALGLTWPKPIANVEFEVTRFLSSSLRHTREDQFASLERATLGPWLRDAFHILNRWALEGEDSNDFARLDQIGAEFERASISFARLVRAERDGSNEIRAEISNLKEQLSVSEAKSLVRKGQLHASTTAQDDLQLKFEVVTSQLEQQAETARGLQAERDQLQSAMQLEQARFEEQLQLQRLQLDESSALERTALEARMKDLEDQLQKQRRTTTLLEAEVYKRTEALEGAEGRLAQTESALRQRQAEADEAWKAVNAANDKLAGTRKSLEGAEAAHRETRSRLAKSEASLQKQQKEFAEERKALQAAQRDIETRFQELAVLSRIASDYEARAKRLEEEQKTLKAKLYAERDHRGALERDLKRLGKSLSWQITRPLRTIGRVWNKLIDARRG